jgi:hypothetical protein
MTLIEKDGKGKYVLTATKIVGLDRMEQSVLPMKYPALQIVVS